MSSKLLKIFNDEKLIEKLRAAYHIYFSWQKWKVRELEKSEWRSVLTRKDYYCTTHLWIW